VCDNQLGDQKSRAISGEEKTIDDGKHVKWREIS
jgi:hypothetical protein